MSTTLARLSNDAAAAHCGVNFWWLRFHHHFRLTLLLFDLGRSFSAAFLLHHLFQNLERGEGVGGVSNKQCIGNGHEPSEHHLESPGRHFSWAHSLDSSSRRSRCVRSLLGKQLVCSIPVVLLCCHLPPGAIRAVGASSGTTDTELLAFAAFRFALPDGLGAL